MSKYEMGPVTITEDTGDTIPSTERRDGHGETSIPPPFGVYN